MHGFYVMKMKKDPHTGHCVGVVTWISKRGSDQNGARSGYRNQLTEQDKERPYHTLAREEPGSEYERQRVSENNAGNISSSSYEDPDDSYEL
jgi:hypothetical protein